jgi:hypothetical protein
MAKVAGVSESRNFRIDVEWDSAPGVATPELAATWARFALWVGSQSPTSVEDSAGVYRRSIYTSVYPLAEWIAFNWWSLIAELRPSALPVLLWTWSNVTSYEWLRRHNIRGAGSGMPWPDVTFVPEGATTRLVWRGGPGLAGQPITFLSNGDAYLPSTEFVDQLARFVDQVIDRLREKGVFDTPLAKEWQALRDTEDEEAAFARAAARLGLDPYEMTTSAQEELIQLSQALEPHVLDEFLDSADPGHLQPAIGWLQQARNRANNLASVRAESVIGEWREILRAQRAAFEDRPWSRGYSAAQEVRRMLGLEPTESLGMDSLVTKVTQGGQSAGLEGLARLSPSDKLILVLPSGTRSAPSVRFAQARSLGLLLASDEDEHLLDPASTDLSKESRACAAELLAPFSGIQQYLSRLPAVTDAAFEAVAARFRTSTWLVRLQYENQISQYT